jgi:tRNA_anti-like
VGETSEIVRIWTVLVGLLLGCVLIGLFEGCKSDTHKEQPALTLDQPAMDFAVFLVEDDIQEALSGQESAMGHASQGALTGWTGIDGRISAKEYESAYDANEIDADNKFKGKKLLLSGIVAGVEKDFTGQGYLTLRGSEPFLGVHAQLSDQSMAGAATLKKGQEITLVCEGGGRIATMAILDNCDPLKDYLGRISPDIKSKVTQFLSGKMALNRTDADIIAMAYVLGQSMPINSQCLTGTKDACGEEMNALSRDKTAAVSIRERLNKLMASVKISPH